eukprot:4625979-Amphidinium_carterae.1
MSKQTLETPEGQKGLYNVTSRVHCQMACREIGNCKEQVSVTGPYLATFGSQFGNRAANTDIMFSRGFEGIRDLS